MEAAPHPRDPARSPVPSRFIHVALCTRGRLFALASSTSTLCSGVDYAARWALALALALPADMPQREVIVTASFAVLAFSVFVQALTLTPLLRRFGEIPKTR